MLEQYQSLQVFSAFQRIFPIFHKNQAAKPSRFEVQIVSQITLQTDRYALFYHRESWKSVLPVLGRFRS